MKLISIKIKTEECAIKWESSNRVKWSVISDRLLGDRFATAIKALSTVAAKSINHDPELMAVRTISVSENKKGITFVKLSGILASQKTDDNKPGKFSTPKIEITLFARDEMKELEESAKEYVRGCDQQ